MGPDGPGQPFDDLIGLAGLIPEDRVIEIGCGTGQATVPRAERGLAVTAVDLGAEPAAIARRRLTGFPAANVVTCSFEEWQPQGVESNNRRRAGHPHKVMSAAWWRPGGLVSATG